MTTLNSSKLQRAGHYRETWEAVVPAETKMDELLSPKYWVHVAAKLRKMSIINVLSEDEHWFAELIVLGSGTGYAKVKCLRHVNFYDEGAKAEEESSIPSDLLVKWAGPHDKYRVERVSDKHVLKSGFQKKQDAESWARQHEALIAA